MKPLDLAGKQFDHFTVIKRVPNLYKDGKSSWLCRCNCGNEMILTSNNIRRSKGCMQCTHKGRQSKKFYIPDSGKRTWNFMLKKNLNILQISEVTGIAYETIRGFFYNGQDISSARLAKICSYLGVSMDYVMGLKKEA